jgi:hypothetical protein
MTVRMPPIISSHPNRQDAVVGREVTFSVAVSDPSQPDLEYMWQVRGPLYSELERLRVVQNANRFIFSPGPSLYPD